MAAILILALDRRALGCPLDDYRCPPAGPRTQDRHPKVRLQTLGRRQIPQLHNPRRHSNRHFPRNQSRWDILKKKIN